uniref:Uncharacterized protein n=1 Tax=Rhizophora mucronata TaxID=61149 RepID=A0A2P2IU93_RHIMU
MDILNQRMFGFDVRASEIQSCCPATILNLTSTIGLSTTNFNSHSPATSH